MWGVGIGGGGGGEDVAGGVGPAMILEQLHLIVGEVEGAEIEAGGRGGGGGGSRPKGKSVLDERQHGCPAMQGQTFVGGL